MLRLISILILCISLTPTQAQESQQDTIQRCLIELKSTDPKIRQRALLLLGKFDNSLVLQASESALSDPDAQVRQTAIVNLSGSFLASRLRNPTAVIKLLQDPNLHNRRLVASNLLRSLIYRVTLSPKAEQAEVAQIIAQALKDPDAKLRLILLNNFYALKGLLNETAFRHLCTDEDAKIQIKALEYMNRSLPQPQLIQAAEQLHTHKDDRIRMRLIKVIARHSSTRSILQKMTQDKNSEIALLANLSLGSSHNVDPIIQTITSKNVSPELMQQAFRIIYRQAKGKSFTFQCLKSDSETLRFYALQNIIRYGETPDRITLFRLINDSSSRIRELIISEINLLEPSTEEIISLTESEYANVLGLALEFISKQKKLSDLREPLIGLLLNDTIKVRQGALVLLWYFKDPERYDFIEQGLSDESPEIRKYANDILLFDKSPQAQKILLDKAE